MLLASEGFVKIPYSDIFTDMGIKEKLGSILSKLKRAKPVLTEEKRAAVKSVSLSDEAWETLFNLYQELGPRPAGSESAARAVKAIKKQIDKVVPDAKVTNFRLVPRLWLCLSNLAVLFSIAMSAATAFGLPYVGLVLGIGITVLVAMNLSCGNGFIKMIFPAKQGANIHVQLDPVGEVKRTVIFSAHHDSAPLELKETTEELLLKNYYLSAMAVIVSGIYSIAALCVELARGYVVMPNMPCIGDIIMLAVSCLFLIPQALVIRNRKRAPFSGGAGDDLSGVSVVIELLRYYRSEPQNGTRLVFVSFDGNECGAQGAASWYAANKDLLVNAVNINFEGLFNEENLVFLAADGNGLVPLSEVLASRCSRLADSMGYTVPVANLGLLGGMTDAVAAANAGIDSTTITSMAPGVKTVAHTEGDLPVTVSKKAMARAMEIVIRYVKEIDGFRPRPQQAALEAPVSLLDDDKKYKLSKY